MITPAEIEASLRQPLAARALPLAQLFHSLVGDSGSGLDGSNRKEVASCRPHPGPFPQERVPASAAYLPGAADCTFASPNASPLPPLPSGSPSPGGEGRGEGVRDPRLPGDVIAPGAAPSVANKVEAHAFQRGGQGPHLVCTSLEDLKAFTPPESILTDAEKTRAAAFKVAHARTSFILGRLAAKLAVGALVGEREWARIGVSNGALGQPLVDAAEVSLSHVEGFAAAVAFPRGGLMGIDLELIDDGRAATVRSEVKLLSAEQAWLQSGQAPEPAARILLWTVREALGKVLRSGLGTPLELLGLRELQPASVPGVFLGHYHNFPACHCVSWLLPGRVLTVALAKKQAL